MSRDEATANRPQVTPRWVAGELAVLAFREFCTRQRWVFTDVPGQYDFGRDGYLDLSNAGQLTGHCIAVQIKGGASYRRSGGYTIRADMRRRTLWSESTIPVFGIVWDPADGALYWLELTSLLRERGLRAPLAVPASNRLDAGGADIFLNTAQRATAGNSIAAAFGSDDSALQEAAIYDCWGFGRHDPRYLVLLRRVMFALHPYALDVAIWVLNNCSINPDIFKDQSWMTLADRRAVRQTFVWNVEEAVMLLDRVEDDDAFTRGSFSLCIYWLLVGTDANSDLYVGLVDAATRRAAETGRIHAAVWGLVLCTYWAGTDGRAAFDALVAQHPVLRDNEIARIVDADLTSFGHIELS